MIYAREETKFEKIVFWGALMPAMVLLFVALTQPVWRGEAMVNEYKSDCKKVGGILLEHESFLGTTYQCSERFDK